MKPYSAVLQWSGGIDSTLCLARLLADDSCEQILPLFFNYRQLGYWSERRCTENLWEYYNEELSCEGDEWAVLLPVKEITVDMPGHWLTQNGAPEEYNPGYSPALVPARNSVFSTIAYFYARQYKFDKVVTGIHGPPPGAVWKGTPRVKFPDCTAEWVAAMNVIYALENRATDRPVELIAPIIDMTKPEIVQEAKERSIPYEMTWACYFPNRDESPCGQCEACVARKVGGLPW